MTKIQQLKQLRKEYDDLCKKCDDAEVNLGLSNVTNKKIYSELNLLITKIYKLNRNIQAGGK
ncbi:hypothetical protein N9N56_00990 [Candidatus Pelagibacter ubique]|nr:hypothetical protein [Candidatus Pelagibacter ubique]